MGSHEDKNLRQWKSSFGVPLVYGEYLGIYRRRIRVRSATRVPQAWGVSPLSLWPPRGSPGLLRKLPEYLVVQEKSLKVSFHLNFVWYEFSVKTKTKEKTTTGALG